MVHDYFLLGWCCKILWISSYENTLFMICKKQGVFTINDVRKIIVTKCEKGSRGDAVTLMNTDTTLLSIFIGEYKKIPKGVKK